VGNVGIPIYGEGQHHNNHNNHPRKLRGHTSCVNAVNFSQKGGQWLASGGDDLRVLLWDMHETEIKTPFHTFIGPKASLIAVLIPPLAHSCSVTSSS
jgi:WD40 repeat protein